MISFLNDPKPAEFEPADQSCQAAEQPRAVGQFMAAVLARYGISAEAEAARLRSPQPDRRSATPRRLLAAS